MDSQITPWEGVLAEVRVESGRELTPDELEKILEYLAQKYPPDQYRRSWEVIEMLLEPWPDECEGCW